MSNRSLTANKLVVTANRTQPASQWKAGTTNNRETKRRYNINR